MKRSDLALLFACAALWGASFMFVRIAAVEFGAVALAGARVAGAALILVAALAVRGGVAEMHRHWKPIAVGGLTNAALPLVLFGYAALSISAGLMSILNAVTPLCAAVVAWVWLGQRSSGLRSAGLVIGFAGVMWLAWGQAGFKTGADSAATLWAIAAAVIGSALYGFSANYTRERLAGVTPLAVAAGGQLVSAAVLAVPAFLYWPKATPSAGAWGALAMLAAACTALAYVLFFKLIGNVGATRATTVSYLIPGFGVAWGALFLGEVFTLDMALGCAVILAGTALASGAIKLRRAACAPV
jgi:drug/metabolite transporter (DMT)-like permease